MTKKILGIDAINIRNGGGVTHLVELLNNCEPYLGCFEKVIIWSKRTTLNDLPDFDWIEKRHNSKIPKIFENNGEEYFRKIEAECFSEIIATDNEKVISTGGGAPLNSGCKNHFLGNEVIFLDAYPDILFQRASNVRMTGLY